MKVVLALMVVVQHTLSGAWMTLAPGSGEWRFISVPFLLSRLAVPLFVMCSGAGMLAKERSIEAVWKKNIFLLLKVYVSWMAVYGIREVVIACMEGDRDIRVLVNMILKSILFGQYHTWFVVMLAGLYMITPFLCRMVQNREHTRYFLLLSFVFTSILPVLGRIEQFDRAYAVIQDMDMQFVVGYVLYYVLGYELAHHVPVRASRMALGLEAGICAAVSLAVWLVCDCLSRASGQANQEILAELSPATVVLCVCIMLLFRRLFMGEGRRMAAVAALSRYGMVVYMVHPLVLWTLKAPADALGLVYAVAAWGISLGIAVVVAKVPTLRKLFSMV